MDILLTHGYFLNGDPHESRIMKPYPPLGILYITAYLKRKGFEAGVFDSTFSSVSEFTCLLKREKPPVVGIYCNLMTKLAILEMIRVAKTAGAAVILGGPEPANYLDEYLDCGADVVVFGEGEEVLSELLASLPRGGVHSLQSVAGIGFRNQDGKIERTQHRPMIADLDSLPDPDREAVDIGRYLDAWRSFHGLGSVSLICARGCPYECAWCSHSVYGHTHRRRSPARVADEVQHLMERYKPDQLWYADDVFTIHHPWLTRFAAELKRRSVRLPFECISRADRLTDPIIDLLSEMGCHRLWIGSESGSQHVLDAMQRGVRIEQVRAMTQALKRRGIQVGMFIMLGYEGEGIREIEETLDHIRRSSPDTFLTTVAYPIKGTEYHRGLGDRIIARAPWEMRTDRDLDVVGRHSRRFYSFAIRWMVNSVGLDNREWSSANALRRAKAAANVAVGRIGMWLTQHEQARQAPRSGAGTRMVTHP